MDQTLVSLPRIGKDADSLEMSLEMCLRPGLHKCLAQLKEHFNLILFSTSPKTVASQVVSFVESEESYFVARFYRDSCVELSTMESTFYALDLSCLDGLNLEETLIVDSSIVHFSLQLGNGVPLLPFLSDMADAELTNLTKYLLSAPRESSLKQFNKHTLRLEDKFKQTNGNSYSETVFQRFLGINIDSSFDSLS